MWSGFYKKSVKERQAQLKLIYPHLFHQRNSQPHDEEGASFIFPLSGLDPQVGDQMVENFIGIMGLPLALAPHFVINGKSLVVPMVIEEASVVAGCSNAAKCIAAGGGFHTVSLSPLDRRTLEAQIQLMDLKCTKEELQEMFKQKKEELMDEANSFCRSMQSRGGGVYDAYLRTFKKSERVVHPSGLDEHNQHGINDMSSSEQGNTIYKPSYEKSDAYWTVLHLQVDVCDAMGANCVNSVAEGLSPWLADTFQCRVGMRILSNLCDKRLYRARFEVPTDILAYKDIPGSEMARRIVEATLWAHDDPYRATTHNKGIMNGVDAVALATGQDWRSIEAAAHAFASMDGQGHPKTYHSLTDYKVTQGPDGSSRLVGELVLPLAVGTQGGVIKSNPLYAVSLGLLEYPDASELAQIMVCVGLAQNLAALRALVSEGIQRGHMALHAKNIAIAAGAPATAAHEVASYMIQSGRITYAAAKAYLEAFEIQSYQQGEDTSAQVKQQPSVLLFEPPFDEHHPYNDKLSLNIVFPSLGNPIILILGPSSTLNEHKALHEKLLGDKSYPWLVSILRLLDQIPLHSPTAIASPSTIQHRFTSMLLHRKLQLVVILFMVVFRHLSKLFSKTVYEFVQRLFEMTQTELVMSRSVDLAKRLTDGLEVDHPLRVGLPLLSSLWQAFDFRVHQWVDHPLLRDRLLQLFRTTIADLVERLRVVTSDREHKIKVSSMFYQMPLLLTLHVLHIEIDHLTSSYLDELVNVAEVIALDVQIAHDYSRLDPGQTADKLSFLKETLEASWFVQMVEKVDPSFSDMLESARSLSRSWYKVDF